MVEELDVDGFFTASLKILKDISVQYLDLVKNQHYGLAIQSLYKILLMKRNSKKSLWSASDVTGTIKVISDIRDSCWSAEESSGTTATNVRYLFTCVWIEVELCPYFYQHRWSFILIIFYYCILHIFVISFTDCPYGLGVWACTNKPLPASVDTQIPSNKRTWCFAFWYTSGKSVEPSWLKK